MVVADFDPGGGGSEGVGTFFQDGDTGSVVVWGGDVGTDPQEGAGPEYFSTQGCATAHWEEAEETGVRELGTTLIVGGNIGSRLRGDWKMCHEEAEYGRALYCDTNNSRPL